MKNLRILLAKYSESLRGRYVPDLFGASENHYNRYFVNSYITGLCGTFDGDSSNDLMMPDGTIFVPVVGEERFPNEFSLSWRYCGLVHLHIVRNCAYSLLLA